MIRSPRALATLVLTLAATAATAHSGHPVPAGVPQAGHLHLGASLTVGPQWLLVLAGVVAVGVAAWRLAVRRAHRPGTARADRRRER